MGPAAEGAPLKLKALACAYFKSIGHPHIIKAASHLFLFKASLYFTCIDRFPKRKVFEQRNTSFHI
jgi:hypothetical protein